MAAVVAGLNAIYGRWTRETTVEAMRRDWDDAFGVRARNWQRQRFQIGNMDAEWISAPQAQPENAILFLHGGPRPPLRRLCTNIWTVSRP